MSVQANTFLNLGKLPSDIIRKIIAFELNSIDDVKLITHRWNALACECLGDCKRFPSIKMCKCFWSSNNKIKITVTLPDAYKKFFGKKSHRTKLLADQYEINIDLTQLMRGEGKEIDFLRRVFERCSSVELFQININIYSGGFYFNPIKRVTGPVKIDELRLEGFYCNYKSYLTTNNTYEDPMKGFSNELVNFAKENNVRLLYFSNFHVSLVKALANFFIEASSFVSIIKFVGGIFPSRQSMAMWQEASTWLNQAIIKEKSKITAKLEEEPAYNKKEMLPIRSESHWAFGPLFNSSVSFLFPSHYVLRLSMSAQQVSAVNLDNLPSDVIRKIIDVGVHSIDDMKLITPRWNALAREHLRNRDRLPAITKCNCDCSELCKIKMSITYPFDFKKYFGMLNKTSANKWSFDNRNEFEVNANNIGFLGRVFDRCSSIELLTVQMGYEESFNVINTLIGTLKINELRFTGKYSREKANGIVSFLKDNTVNLLRLSIFDVGFVKESENFFIEVSSAVSKIRFMRDEWALAETDEQMAILWDMWKGATKWLNETGKITAKLDEDPMQIGNWLQMCITIERREDS